MTCSLFWHRPSSGVRMPSSALCLPLPLLRPALNYHTSALPGLPSGRALPRLVAPLPFPMPQEAGLGRVCEGGRRRPDCPASPSPTVRTLSEVAGSLSLYCPGPGRCWPHCSASSYLLPRCPSPQEGGRALLGLAGPSWGWAWSGQGSGRAPDAPLDLGLPDIRVATARQRCLDPQTKHILVHEDLVVGCTEPGPRMQNR